MTTEHPITPPPELRRLWAQQAQRLDPHDPVAWMEHVSTQAACWGADQELEACVEWLIEQGWFGSSNHEAIVDLRAARRPKPQNLKEQALDVIENSEICDHLSPEHAAILRRAVEALDALCPQGHHAPGPEPLSPAAQTVLAAYYCEKPLVGSKRIAAALRAAAWQLREAYENEECVPSADDWLDDLATELENQ